MRRPGVDLALLSPRLPQIDNLSIGRCRLLKALRRPPCTARGEQAALTNKGMQQQFRDAEQVAIVRTRLARPPMTLLEARHRLPRVRPVWIRLLVMAGKPRRSPCRRSSSWLIKLTRRSWRSPVSRPAANRLSSILAEHELPVQLTVLLQRLCPSVSQSERAIYQRRPMKNRRKDQVHE